jgi:hypothetical protein
VRVGGKWAVRMDEDAADWPDPQMREFERTLRCGICYNWFQTPVSVASCGHTCACASGCAHVCLCCAHGCFGCSLFAVLAAIYCDNSAMSSMCQGEGEERRREIERDMEMCTHTDTDTHRQGRADTHRHRRGRADTHRHTDTHRDTQTETGRYRHTQTDRDRQIQTHTDRHRQGRADTHRHTDTDTHRHTHTHIRPLKFDGAHKLCSPSTTMLNTYRIDWWRTLCLLFVLPGSHSSPPFATALQLRHQRHPLAAVSYLQRSDPRLLKSEGALRTRRKKRTRMTTLRLQNHPLSVTKTRFQPLSSLRMPTRLQKAARVPSVAGL